MEECEWHGANGTMRMEENGMESTVWRSADVRVRHGEYECDNVVSMAVNMLRMEECEWKDAGVRVWAREYECENGMESANGRVQMAECKWQSANGRVQM
jgi:hypothetical protein